MWIELTWKEKDDRVLVNANHITDITSTSEGEKVCVVFLDDGSNWEGFDQSYEDIKAMLTRIVMPPEWMTGDMP